MPREIRVLAREIERLIANDNWAPARRLIRVALRQEPEDHWFMTRMGLTYYEQRRYREAMKWARAALRHAPDCPLVLWDYAGALDMLGRKREALTVYRKLIRRGVQRVAFGDCGEGLRWARALLADCYYRIAWILLGQGYAVAARRAARSHLLLRRGARSIYSLSDLRELESELGTKK